MTDKSCSTSKCLQSLVRSAAATFKLPSWRSLSPASSETSEDSSATEAETVISVQGGHTQEHSSYAKRAPAPFGFHGNSDKAARGAAAGAVHQLARSHNNGKHSSSSSKQKDDEEEDDDDDDDQDEIDEERASRARLVRKIHVECIDCNNPNPQVIEDYKAGDLICGDCGAVIGERILEDKAEWRNFDDGGDGKHSDDPSRVGGVSNKLLEESGLMLGIDSDGTNAKTLQRLMADTTRESGDHHLLEAFKEISVMAEAIGVSGKVKQRANLLYKQLTDKEQTRFNRHKAKRAVIAAALYTACRQEGTARSIKEICSLTGVSKKELSRAFKHLNRMVDTNLKSISTDDFMGRFCNQLHLPNSVMKAAKHVASRAVEEGVVGGKCPISVAAASIYAVSVISGKCKTQQEISVVAGITHCTVRNAFKDIQPYMKDLLPDGFADCSEISKLQHLDVGKRCWKEG